MTTNDPPVIEITESPMTSCQCANPEECPVCIASEVAVLRSLRDFTDEVIEAKMKYELGAYRVDGISPKHWTPRRFAFCSTLEDARHIASSWGNQRYRDVRVSALQRDGSYRLVSSGVRE